MKRLNWTAAAAVCALSLQAAVPTGWFLAGTKPQEYDCSVDPAAAYNDLPSTYLKSKEGVKTTGFGTMMQSFSAAPYAGKRVRYTANLKSENVESWGGLWLRADGDNNNVVAFDNMQDRAVTGTTPWKNYSIVLDIPENAASMYMGLLLAGSGTLWINGIKLEVVGNDVPVTHGSMKVLPPGPVNLGFDK